MLVWVGSPKTLILAGLFGGPIAKVDWIRTDKTNSVVNKIKIESKTRLDTNLPQYT